MIALSILARLDMQSLQPIGTARILVDPVYLGWAMTEMTTYSSPSIVK